MTTEPPTSRWPGVNPYPTGDPVFDDRTFFGRDALVGDLKRYMDASVAPVVVIEGPRRVGKTSLLLHYLNSATAVGKHWVYFDLYALRSRRAEWAPGHLAAELFSELEQEIIRKIGGVPEGRPEKQTPHAFRLWLAKFLRVASLSLIVALDEMQVLADVDPRSVADILTALTEPPDPLRPEQLPATIIVWGHSWRGSTISQKDQLKTARRLQVGAFQTDEVVAAITRPAEPFFTYAQGAIDAFRKLTALHPAYVGALGAAIYERRRHTQDIGPVEAQEVVEAAPDAIRHHMFGSCEHIWHQLAPEQRLLTWAIFEATGDDHEASVGLEGALEILRREGYVNPEARWPALAEDLVSNEILAPSAGTSGAYRIKAPLFAGWVAFVTISSILSEAADEDPFASREFMRGKAALIEADQARENGEAEREQLALDSALSAFNKAENENRHLWMAAFEIAAVLERKGEVDQAIHRLRQLHGRFSQNEDIRRRLCGVLLEKARFELGKGSDPERWLSDIEQIDPAFAFVPEAEPFVAEVWLARWEREIQNSPPASWQDFTALFQRHASKSWLRGITGSYCKQLRATSRTSESFPHVLSLVREIFPIIIKNTPSTPAVTRGDRAARDRLRKLDSIELSPEVKAQLVEIFAPGMGEETTESPVDVAWELTLRLVRLCLEGGDDLGLEEHRRLSAALLEEWLYYAPEPHASELRRLCLELLPKRFEGALREGTGDAVAILRVLVRHRRMEEIERVQAIFSDHVLLAVEDTGNARCQAMFEHGAELCAFLLDSHRELGPSERQTRGAALLEEVELLVQRFRSGKDATGPDGLVLDEKTLVSWRQVMSRFELFDLAKARHLKQLLDIPTIEVEAEKPQPRPTSSPQPVIAVRHVQDLLPSYHVTEVIPYDNPALPKNAVQLFRAERNNEEVAIRVYQIAGDGPRSFLRWLWENEQRALYNLSHRWKGRALTSLKEAVLLEEEQKLLLVTEWIGRRTLREELNSGRRGMLQEGQSRRKLWRHLHALIDAVAALHRFGYLHRAVRPENIFVNPVAEKVAHRAWLKLGNFEWSVYLHALTSAQSIDRQEKDYYIAPETLAQDLNVQKGDVAIFGEAFSSDIYSLGLVLFECLVRPVSSELRRFFHAGAYDYEEHLNWIGGLRKEVDGAVERKLLDRDEADVIRSLLAGRVADRAPELESVSDLAGSIALREGATGHRPKLSAICNMILNTPGPHRASNLEKLLRQAIDVPLLDGLPFEERRAKLKDLLERELRNARVYVSEDDQEFPLLIIGARVAFRAAAYRHHDEITYKQIAFLEVTVLHGVRKTPPIAILDGVEVHDKQDALDVHPFLRKSDSWEELFTLAEKRDYAMPPEHRKLHRTVALSVELEKDVWGLSVYPVRVVRKTGEPVAGTTEEIVIEQNGPNPEGQKLDLVNWMAQQADRETHYFELSYRSAPMMAFDIDSRWGLVWIDPEESLLHLTRVRTATSEDPPEYGCHVRPWGLALTRVLYNRRLNLLRQLADDTFLLDAVTRPAEIAQDLRVVPTGPRRVELRHAQRVEATLDSAVRAPEFFNHRLDDVKRKLVEQIHARRPLFVVQGPPGTGKTTLAAEVILQLLAENPSARILIASQAHDPLNNLLEVVHRSLPQLRPKGKDGEGWQQPMIIRLMNRERIDRNLFGDEGTRIGREFSPSAVATKSFTDARQWKPKPDVNIDDEQILARWHAFLESQDELSVTFEERVVNSANLVFATANDRQLARLREDSFDLVVFEEAAKAYSIELLSAMRLARRWLLIGDQFQLPPFGVEQLYESLERVVTRYRQQHPARDGAAGEAPVPDDIYTERERLAKRVDWEILDEPDTAERQPRGAEAGPSHVDLPEDLLGFATTHELSEYIRERTLFFDHLHRLCSDARNPVTLAGRLTIQWRMHPKIGDMVKEIFYDFLENGRDRTGATAGKTKRHRWRKPDVVQDQQLVWIDVPHVSELHAAGEEEDVGRGRSNGYEVRALLGFLRQAEGGKQSVAILSPYRAQVRLLQKFFSTFDRDATGRLEDRVFTVDSFQGRQADVVALSLVRNNRCPEERAGIGFLKDQRRAAVMFSRAESLLVVVGCSNHFKRFSGDAKWIYEVYQHFERYGRVIKATDFVHDRFEQRQIDYQINRLRKPTA